MTGTGPSRALSLIYEIYQLARKASTAFQRTLDRTLCLCVGDTPPTQISEDLIAFSNDKIVDVYLTVSIHQATFLEKW